ncbi:hypothetical protein ASPZODRAFT_157509, partial [Penicilliopsis zonata CBS 506.65]
ASLKAPSRCSCWLLASVCGEKRETNWKSPHGLLQEAPAGAPSRSLTNVTTPPILQPQRRLLPLLHPQPCCRRLAA